MCNWDISKFQQNMIQVASIHQHLFQTNQAKPDQYWTIIENNTPSEIKLADDADWIDMVIMPSDSQRLRLSEDIYELQQQVTEKLPPINIETAIHILKEGLFVVMYPRISL